MFKRRSRGAGRMVWTGWRAEGDRDNAAEDGVNDVAVVVALRLGLVSQHGVDLDK